MHTLTVNLGERSYPIHIGQDLLADPNLLSAHLTSGAVALITNDVVDKLYAQQLLTTLADRQVHKIVLPDGEQYKTLDTFDRVMGELLQQNLGRDTTLIALGGGVIGDLAGFAAACYQRGIPFIQVPTTLLAQVDSSVGGKTAVNHPLGKNMIGAFYQPQLVVIDTQTLQTLPDREFAAGMAEVIKYGIIYDAEFFTWLESQQQALLARLTTVLAQAIQRCCEIKAEIVAQDEREGGIRALLNLGHTFGHAIEAEMGYGQWLHGEAVAAGIIIACRVSEHKGWLQASETRRIHDLLQAFALPVAKPENMHFDAFMRQMRRDKKVEQGQIRFILPKGVGQAVVSADVDESLLRSLLN